MADTMDRRSEGKGNSPSRQRAKSLKALGMCCYCGKTPVEGRDTCYGCSTKTGVHGRRSHIRKGLEAVGIDIDTDDRMFTALIEEAREKVDNTFDPVRLPEAEARLKFLEDLNTFFFLNQRVNK